jgi:hypothetical protein
MLFIKLNFRQNKSLLEEKNSLNSQLHELNNNYQASPILIPEWEKLRKYQLSHQNCETKFNDLSKQLQQLEKYIELLNILT